MPYDLELVRAILRQFGVKSVAPDFINAAKPALSPPHVVGVDPATVPLQLDRLIDVGLVERTHEIHMQNHDDPVTLRATEAGRVWVRRAHNDAEWQLHLPVLVRLLETGSTD